MKWQPVRGYEGLYEVSNYGQIRGIDRIETLKDGRKRFRHGKQLATMTKRHGYQAVNLYSHGAMKTVLVHRLVAQVFVPNPDGKPEVNHINGDKSDNRASNLEWVTSAENIRHAYEIGLKKADHHGRLSNQQIRDIRASHEKQKEIAKRHRISRTLVGLIKQRKIYKEVI